MAGSLGMATGPVVGGMIFDATGTSAGLYITGALFGLAACGIAATVRPLPRGPVLTAA